jgi:ATP-dependent RNA helicase DDX56/DBP9
MGCSRTRTFPQLGLDARVVEAVLRKLRWRTPAPVQEAVIPAVLSGKDVLVNAPTGSGKTGAYALPLVHLLLQIYDEENARGAWCESTRAIVLVPSQDLALQLGRTFVSLTENLPLHCCVVTGAVSNKALIDTWTDASVCVGTPAGLAQSLTTERARNVVLLVIDEADLVLSFASSATQVHDVVRKIPTNAQGVLLSATLDEEVEALRALALHQPEACRIEASWDADPSGNKSNVQYWVSRLSGLDERFAWLYVVLRLRILRDRILVFVDSVLEAYRVKLFLDRFGIRCAVLNADLPVTSRQHCLQQFDAGIFDILVTSDEATTLKSTGYSASRGLDFRSVDVVIHFTAPKNIEVFLHRSGRTGRAGRAGKVVTLVTNDDESQRIERFFPEHARLSMQGQPRLLAVRKETMETFRYRVEDALCACTDLAVREARVQALRDEMLRSRAFRDALLAARQGDRVDLEVLSHDRPLVRKRLAAHLGHIPDYMLKDDGLWQVLAPEMANAQSATDDLRPAGPEELNKPVEKRPKRKRIARNFRSGPRKRAEPLKRLRL